MLGEIVMGSPAVVSTMISKGLGRSSKPGFAWQTKAEHQDVTGCYLPRLPWRDIMRTSLKTLLAAALVFGGVTAFETTDASAQPRWRARAPAGDTYAPRFGGRAYGPPGAYYGRRYYGGYPAYGYRRGYGYYNGGAVAAGLVGGLALGAIAGAASNPYYYGPGYYRPAYYAPGRCVVERRRVVNRYGRVVFQRIRTCY
jgi:hypothetical protein